MVQNEPISIEYYQPISIEYYPRLFAYVVLDADWLAIVQQYSNLKILKYRENNITYLPDEISNLLDLKVIDMAENNLQYLPIGMKEIELKVTSIVIMARIR